MQHLERGQRADQCEQRGGFGQGLGVARVQLAEGERRDLAALGRRGRVAGVRGGERRGGAVVENAEAIRRIRAILHVPQSRDDLEP
jgi:hypothetical protein